MPLEDWELSFDYGREIVSISNAAIVSHEGTRYVIRNVVYNADIAAEEAVHIGIVAGEGSREEIPHGFFLGEKTGGGTQEIPDTPEVPGTEDEEEPLLFMIGEYNAETNSIDMKWYTDAEESGVTLWSSADNAVYEEEAAVSGETSYSYRIVDEFEIKYFKASVRDGKHRENWER